jgi:hypothetical protein
MHGMKTKPKQHLCAWRRKEIKVKDAYCALYVTALVAYALELETTILHVPDPTVGCICTATMVAIPLFPIYIYIYIETLLDPLGAELLILHPGRFTEPARPSSGAACRHGTRCNFLCVIMSSGFSSWGSGRQFLKTASTSPS